MAAGGLTRRRAVALAGLLALLAGCAGPGSRPAVTTLEAPATTSTAPPPSTTLGRAAVAGCPAVPTPAAPSPDRPRYVLTAAVDPALGMVNGNLTVRFTPDLVTDRLVFRLWPNSPATRAHGADLEMGPVEVDGRPVAVARENLTTLVARPALPLRAGRTVEITTTWQLTVPRASGDRISLDGEAMRLGSFFPILAWEPGTGWATEPPVGGFAEASTAPTADFDLTVTAPEGFTVLASGVPDGPNRWKAQAMRDVAVAVGRFAVVRATAHAPHPVEVTVGAQDGLGEPPEAYLRQVVRVMEDFSRRYGPYPWTTFVLSLTPALGGGIEYPGHVLQGRGTLGRTTSHEVGHMWFYGLVGNDQGRDPWLDEGLATWTEVRAEGDPSRLSAIPVPPVGMGRVSEPMTFWNAHPDAYYRSVYVQGAQAVAALGAPDLVDCALRVYAAVNAHRIARPADLVAAAAAVFPDAEATLARFGVRR